MHARTEQRTVSKRQANLVFKKKTGNRETKLKVPVLSRHVIYFPSVPLTPTPEMNLILLTMHDSLP